MITIPGKFKRTLELGREAIQRFKSERTFSCLQSDTVSYPLWWCIFNDWNAKQLQRSSY
jgi:hypothetical protein